MASKRNKRRRSCESKKAYPSQTEAVSAVIGLSRKGSDVHTYKCQFCHRWHVGHQPYRIKQAIEAKQNRRG